MTGTATAAKLAPVTGAARIEILDVLRGIAILGIFYMNVTFMASSGWRVMTDIRLTGWTLADQWAWQIVGVLGEGTMRGMLELLFGAGMMLLARRAMTPDGPVAIADLYMRRNLWLLVFGLADIFAMLWVGDILFIYALAALFLFPFRLLSVRWLIPLGLLFATVTAVAGTIDYVGRASLMTRIAAADARGATGAAATPADAKARGELAKVLDRRRITPERQRQFAAEDRAHAGGLIAYATFLWSTWTMLLGKGAQLVGVAEAFCVMLLGIAAWKLGVTQGERSRRFYWAMLAVCYGFGLTARIIATTEIMAFTAAPKTGWITAEFARIATSLGHVALVNLAFATRRGRAVLAPFRAAGQTAFSLYFLTSFIGLWIVFAPWGPGLWMRWSWFGQTVFATATIALLLAIANLWVRWFASGPLEWLWRSLSYCELQPFRRRAAASAKPLDLLAQPG